MPDSIEQFTIELDKELQAVNSDYASKRKGNMVLEFPEIVVSKPKTFYTWLKNWEKLGGQHKIPKLCNDRTTIEQLLIINNE